MITNEAAVMSELALLVRVVEGGSFSAAARSVDMTPSAVSRARGRLEAALGTQILRRTTRQLALADAGEAVYRHAKLMLEVVAGAVAVAQEDPTPRGRLCIAAPRALGRHVVYPRAMAFAAAHPAVDMVLMFEDLPVDMIADRVDILMAITERPPAGLAGQPVMHVDQILCAAPDYLSREGAPGVPKDLRHHDCITLSDQAEDVRWRFRQGDKRETVRIKGRLAINHSGLRLEQAIAGRGIAVVPAFVAQEALAAGLVVQVLSAWQLQTNFEGTAWALFRASRQLAPVITAFIKALSADYEGTV